MARSLRGARRGKTCPAGLGGGVVCLVVDGGRWIVIPTLAMAYPGCRKYYDWPIIPQMYFTIPVYLSRAVDVLTNVAGPAQLF